MTDIRASAEKLAGAPVEALEPAGHAGGNNRLWRLRAGGRDYALKSYPAQAADPRDRLGVEFAALTFLRSRGVADVPEAIARDDAARLALYEWVEGERVTAPEAAEVRACIGFLGRMAALSDDAPDGLPDASAHTHSGAMVVEQAGERLAGLADAAAALADLAAFLDGDLKPALAAREARARALYAEAGLDFAARLGRDRLILSPSDFGLHNALKTPDGRLVFLDFEYFGWDDPAKALADFTWHAGMDLSADLRVEALQAAMPVFAAREPAFAVRFDALSPLFAVLWCLIMLNEFRADRWERRVLAGQADDRAAVQARQLARARKLLAAPPPPGVA